MHIFVSGSLAYDRIMDFPGRFQDHILPEKIHILNVCFMVNGLIERFGGTAGNIAYNLALLGERPVILATGGFQANTAMRVQYLGREAGDLLVRGSKYDTGEGVRMALRLGAQSYGDWGGFHSAVLDARSPQVEAGETNVNT